MWRSSLYWRLSGFYWSYFALVGSFMPFWGLYLKHQGFSILAISQLLAISSATKLVAPNLWGYLADRFSIRIAIIRLGAFGAFTVFLCVFLPLKFVGMFFMMSVFSFFWNAILPQFEVVTLRHLVGRTHIYSRIRSWGSFGFIISVVGGGILFDYISIDYLPYFMLALLLTIFLSSCWVAEPEWTFSPKQQKKDFWQQLKQPSMMVFFLVCFLMQFSHGPYYTLFSIYLDKLHYSHAAIGGLWALGVFSEIVLFWLIPRWFQRYSLSSFILIATLLAAVRWFLLGYFANYLIGLIVAQLLHAATFALFHLACLHWVHKYFSADYQGQGQALYNSIGYGAGGSLGALSAGILWKLGSSTLAFVMAGVVCLIASIVIAFGLRHLVIQYQGAEVENDPRMTAAIQEQ